jgi:hypothetical protein
VREGLFLWKKIVKKYKHFFPLGDIKDRKNKREAARQEKRKEDEKWKRQLR